MKQQDGKRKKCSHLSSTVTSSLESVIKDSTERNLHTEVEELNISETDDLAK